LDSSRVAIEVGCLQPITIAIPRSIRPLATHGFLELFRASWSGGCNLMPSNRPSAVNTSSTTAVEGGLLTAANAPVSARGSPESAPRCCTDTQGERRKLAESGLIFHCVLSFDGATG
jgi:hypothetical protein